MSKTAKSRSVVFVLFDGMQLLDVAGASDVFAVANDASGRAFYNVIFAASARGAASSSGLMLRGTPLAELSSRIDTLFVPGGPEEAIKKLLCDRPMMTWLSRVVKRAARIASVCSGAFVLGTLGVLDRRRATTHWASLTKFAKAFPHVTVDRESLFVEDGRIWTSAGVTTGIDMAMAMVTRDLGAEIALEVARQLVLHVVRPGGQSQFSKPLALQARQGPDLERLIPWLESRLDTDIVVEHMAEAMGMTERTFHRRCLKAYGLAPGKLLSELRFDRSRMLLGDRAVPISTVAFRSGFSDATAFSKAFARRYGVSPASYRRAFGQNGIRSVV